MSIYSISQNVEAFLFFAIDDIDVYEKMDNFNIDGFGQALEFRWVAPKSEFLESDSDFKVMPDMSQWTGSDLVLSSNAKNTLSNILGNLGEYLELAGKAKDYCLFNPTQRIGNEIVNLKETKSSYFDDGSWKQIEKLVFNKEAGSQVPAVFTIGMDSGTTLFCNQAFKDTVESNNLKGLIFSEVEQV